MATDRIVAIAPATNDTTMVGRAPTSSCEKMSWPSWVWPSQCCEEGFGWVLIAIAPGSYGATQGPTIARMMKPSSRMNPTQIFGECGMVIARRRLVIAQRSCRVRGSNITYTMSASRFAARTTKVMIKKIPCTSG